MGDFRVGPVAPCDKYRDQESPDSAKRRKAKRPDDPEQDDVVVLSEPSEASAESVEDYYSPAPETEESK
ncbi:MAG: hypothetical protein ABSH05_15310 [Bryobacteraceae bacterium]|jgi:hypothetical protein